MNATTLDGRAIEIPPSALDALKARLKGPVLFPGDAGYDDARTVWNAMIDRRPACVVRCLGTADVIACVQFAREHRLLLCIKGGGHNIAGLATADGALMLDLSLMRGVWVDAKKKVAHAQGGCLLGDIDRETQLHGLATVLGFVSATGACRTHPWRRIRLPDPALGLDHRQRGGLRSRHRRGEAGPRQRQGESRSLLGAARRRRQLRRRDRHRLRPPPGRPGNRRRGRRLARQRGAGRPQALPPPRREGVAQAHPRHLHAAGAAGALAPQGDARPAHHRHPRLPQRQAGGGRKGGQGHQEVRQADR